MTSVKQPVGPDPTALQDLRWVGKSVPRKEDPKLLTGRAQYVGDVTVTGMLHGAVLRSPHANARIRSIDTSRAKALPGVVAVLTGADAAELIEPMTAFCAEPVPQHAIAVERVRFPGEAVAAVAATSRYIAEDACALIDVDYEVLPAIVDPVAAMDAALAARARHARQQRRVPAHDRLRRGRRRLRARRPRDPPHRALAPDGRPADGDGGHGRVVGPVRPVDDAVVEHELLQLPAVDVREHAARPEQPPEGHPVHGRRELRQQAPHQQGDRDRRGADEGDRAPGEVHGGPGRQPRGERQRRPRPPLRRGARRHRRRRVPLAQARDHRRLRRLLPVRPRPARQRAVAADRAVPDREPALRDLLRADEQGPAGVLPRGGRRPGQPHPRAPRRRDRRRARDRARGDPTAELHPARAVPLQGPDRQHVRQRQLRGRARPRARAGRRRRLARRAGEGARGGPLHRHRPGELPGALGLQRDRVVVPLRRPAAARHLDAREREDRRQRVRPGPRRARLPAVGQQPRDGRQPGRRRGVRDRPVRRRRHLQRLVLGRDLGRPGRQPPDDHALRRRARRVADDQGQDGPHRGALDGGRPRRRRARRRRSCGRRARRARR